MNWWNVRQYFSCWSSNRKTHLPTIEKPGALILAVCQNQGKHSKLSDTWKSMKTFFKKITGDDTKRQKLLKYKLYLTKPDISLQEKERNTAS